MNRLITDNSKEIERLCKLYKVKSLYAFGSICSRKFKENSDIDLIINFYPMDFGDYTDTYFELIEHFEKIFNRKVDLITEKSLNNPYFIESINKNKTKIYEDRN